MKQVYCSKCHTELKLILKALPQYGRVVTLVDPHECLEEPLELNLEPVKVPVPENVIEDQTIADIDGLDGAGILGSIGTDNLKDRRAPEHIKSSAPEGIIEQILNAQPSTPENDISNEPEKE